MFVRNCWVQPPGEEVEWQQQYQDPQRRSGGWWGEAVAVPRKSWHIHQKQLSFQPVWIYKQTNLNHTHTLLKEYISEEENFSVSLQERFDFFLFFRLVVENVLMSNSSGFNFDQILPTNNKVLYLVLVGEGVLMSNPSGLQSKLSFHIPTKRQWQCATMPWIKWQCQQIEWFRPGWRRGRCNLAGIFTNTEFLDYCNCKFVSLRDHAILVCVYQILWGIWWSQYNCQNFHNCNKSGGLLFVFRVSWVS